MRWLSIGECVLGCYGPCNHTKIKGLLLKKGEKMKTIIMALLLSVSVFAEEPKTEPIELDSNCQVTVQYSHFTFGSRCWSNEVMTGSSFQPGFEGVYCSKIKVQCTRIPTEE